MNEPIFTELGRIDGRNGIYLDEMKQEMNKLRFIGDLNGKLCSENVLGFRWYSYEMIFSYVQAYECQELEICKLKVQSSFDEVKDSDLVKELKLENKEYKHFILSTYDYVYSIIAKEFELRITGSR